MKLQRYGKVVLVWVAIFIFACNIPATSSATPLATPSATPLATPSATRPLDAGTAIPSLVPTEERMTDPTIAVTGPMEIVYDWTTQRCDTNDRPDMPIRPFRDADGNVQANRSWPTNRRFLGPDLDSIKPLCEFTLVSDFDPDPARYNNQEWFQAFYTEDGQTIHAIVHNEQNERGTNYWNMTYARSTDGGATFQQPEPPNHFVAGSPYPLKPDSGLYGAIGGSNIVKGPDGAYYMLVLTWLYQDRNYVCLYRTEDVSDPTSWRAWDGSDFGLRPINPYLEKPGLPSSNECAPIDDGVGGMGGGESLIYNTYLGRYVSVSLGPYWQGGKLYWGAVYSTSKDLIHWENKKLLQEMTLGAHTGAGGKDGTGYLILLDPDSDSRNFETADKTAYIYFSLFRYSSGMLPSHTDLMRFPVEFFPNKEEALKADVRTKITLTRQTNGGQAGFKGRLTRLDGSPAAGASVQIAAMPDDQVGIPHEYTFTGKAPDNVTKATAGFRVNDECSCNGNSEFFIYEISYMESDGKNRVQGNRFQDGMNKFFKWGKGLVTTEASDQGSGRMMHVQASEGQAASLNSWEFTVTPGAEFTYTVRARVVPGSFGSGFFGLFLIADQGEGLRVAIPFFNPPTVLGTVTTDANGEFVFPWLNAPSGKYEIEASYAGNGSDWPSSAKIKTIVK